MLSRSNPALSSASKSKRCVKVVSKNGEKQKNVNEKGDASTTCSGVFDEQRKTETRPLSQVRRQRSTPSLPTQPTKSSSKKLDTTLRPASAFPTVSPKVTPSTIVLAKKSPSVDSNLSVDSVEKQPKRVCEALEKDPKLKAMCLSLGISPCANTLVGPIEKGQLIIGTLQDTLQSLIRMKIKKAERQGERFHIQQSGLDIARRALRNAERSLKTIKESKQPVLGKARQQRSSESLIRSHMKTTDAVIRILNSTKEKFDKMENTGNRFLHGVSLVSAFSSSSASPPSSTGFSGYATRRTSGTSVLTTPVTAYSMSTITAACSRARTAVSSTSVGTGLRLGSHGKLISSV